MDNITLFILVALLLANLISLSIMVYDKNLAITGQRRISEGALFFWAILFGGLGIYLGMLAFRHKTRKWYFYFGIPLIMVQNAACLIFIYELLKGVCIVL